MYLHTYTLHYSIENSSFLLLQMKNALQENKLLRVKMSFILKINANVKIFN